jgi:hypothetical protein
MKIFVTLIIVIGVNLIGFIIGYQGEESPLDGLCGALFADGTAFALSFIFYFIIHFIII